MAEWTPPSNQVFTPGSVPAPQVIDHSQAGEGLLKTWSASSLKNYETCPHRLRLEKVEGVERQEHPAATRGTAMHDIAECFVKAEEGAIADSSQNYVPEWETKIFPRFKARLVRLRDAYAEGKVEVEGEWAFTTEWAAVPWDHPQAWARMKLDVLRWESDTSATVIDYKTGRKYGNEISHATQGMIYTIGTFMRYDNLELVECNFWYLDHDEDNPQRYSREQAMVFLPRITDRATIMTTDTELRPKPSKYTCRSCSVKEHCDYRAD